MYMLFSPDCADKNADDFCYRPASKKTNHHLSAM
jgi:hypothetical protein